MILLQEVIFMTKKRKLIISIITAFMMAFTVVPYMNIGGSYVAEAVESTCFETDVTFTSADSGSAVYTESIYLNKGRFTYSYSAIQGSGLFSYLQPILLNSSNSEVTTEDGYNWTISTAGNYTFQLKIKGSPSGTCKVHITGTNSNKYNYATSVEEFSGKTLNKEGKYRVKVWINSGDPDQTWNVYSGKKLIASTSTGAEVVKQGYNCYIAVPVEPEKEYTFGVDYGTPLTDGDEIFELCHGGPYYEALTWNDFANALDVRPIGSATQSCPRYDKITVYVSPEGGGTSAEDWDGVALYTDITKDPDAILTKTNSNGEYSYTFTKRKPGKKYTVYVFPFVNKGSTKLLAKQAAGVYTIKASSFTAPTVEAAKLGTNKATVTIKVPANQKSSGCSKFLIYKGTKLLKTVKNTGKSTYTVIVKGTKAGIGKLKVTAKAALSGYSGYKASRTVKVKANVSKWNYSTSPSSYSGLDVYWRPLKLYYSNGKLKIKGVYVNTHILDYKMKVKVTIKNGSTKIASKTFSAVFLRGDTSKVIVNTFSKCKKNCNLRNISISYSVYDLGYK